MPANDRKAMVKRIVDRALQEWRARPRVEQPQGQAVAHRIVHTVFSDLPKRAFAVKRKSKRKTA